MKGLEFIFLAVGSVLGAFLRYKVTESPLIFNTLPLNVLIVNVIGAFVLGAFIVVSEQWNIDGRYSLFAAVGFCGSLTTMSSFALDSSNLIESNHYGTLAANIIANVGLSIGALIGGKSLMSAIISSWLEMVYSYQVVKFQTISFVQGTHWSQSVGDKGILYKSLKDPSSKLIVQTNGSKKLFRVPKDRTVIVTNDVVHFLGELA